MKRNLKLTVAYDGTRYKGFQRLGNTPLTIQERIETCISRLLNEEIKIIGSSRTDAGVHALEQVANFCTESGMEIREMIRELNRLLPDDIVIRDIEEVPPTFHSRYWVTKKTYLYRIYTNPVPPLFERQYVHNLGKPLDVEKMREAAGLLIGEHDFTAYSRPSGKRSPVKRIYDLTIEETETEVRIYITADSFLYNMARIIVGTLIDIGLNNRDVTIIQEMFETRNRSLIKYIAPPEGLILYKNYFRRDS